MTTPRVTIETRQRLTALWQKLHVTQSDYIAAQVRADLTAISLESTDEHTALCVATKEAQDRREATRAQLRQEYAALFGERGAERVDAYIAACDAMYGPSARYSFVSKTGPQVKELTAIREEARRAVNHLTRRPNVLSRL